MSALISPSLRARSVQDWPGHRLLVREPLRLDCGIDFGPFTIAYQTYGTLNPDRSNAVLVCHALTGDQYVADPHPITGKPGWWRRWSAPDWCSTPTGSSLSVPTCSVAAWGRPVHKTSTRRRVSPGHCRSR